MSGDDVVPRDWLEDRVTVRELEADPSRAPRGDRWQDFKGKIQASDEVWRFCSPPESWENHAGRMGIAVVRDGRVVLDFVTLVN